MKILVILAHPNMEASILNANLKTAILKAEDITLHELYETYSDEEIDIEREQALLEAHDRIIFQFPNYWYSYPPLLKKWFDVVLERGWAFKGRHELKGKEFGVAITSAFTAEDYRFDGLHRHSIEQILAPFYATCNFIRVKSLPVFSVFEEEANNGKDYERQAEDYLRFLQKNYSFHYETKER